MNLTKPNQCDCGVCTLTKAAASGPPVKRPKVPEVPPARELAELKEKLRVGGMSQHEYRQMHARVAELEGTAK